MAQNSMGCDDLPGPSRTGFDPSMDWRRCLQKDLSPIRSGPDSADRLGEP